MAIRSAFRRRPPDGSGALRETDVGRNYPADTRLERRSGHTHGNRHCDSDSNGYSHRDRYGDSDSYGRIPNAHGNTGNGYRDSNRHRNCNRYGDRDTDYYRNRQPNAYLDAQRQRHAHSNGDSISRVWWWSVPRPVQYDWRRSWRLLSESRPHLHLPERMGTILRGHGESEKYIDVQSVRSFPLRHHHCPRNQRRGYHGGSCQWAEIVLPCREQHDDSV